MPTKFDLLRVMYLNRFYLLGISYKKADALTRGVFAMNESDIDMLLSHAHQYDIEEIIILSTCNRTEVYALCDHPHTLEALLTAHSHGDIAILKQKGYLKSNREAVQHFFEVTAGLDAQILGDYEIIGQVKCAFSLSKKARTVGVFIERLYNTALASSKSIKNHTLLSSGNVSVSSAVIQYILQRVDNPAPISR